MRALVVRDLIVIGRRPALAIVMSTYVALLAGFVFAWEDAIPIGGPNLYELARLLQWGLLAVCLTWTAARCPPLDRGDDLVMASALTALRPSSIIVAKAIALSAALAMVTIAGLPVAIIAQQIAAVPASHVLRDLVSLLGLALLVSAVTLSWTVLVGGRLAAWLGASGSVGVLLALSWRWRPLGLGLGPVSALVGLTLVVIVAAWSDRSPWYLADRNT
jgi:hypothetical protein